MELIGVGSLFDKENNPSTDTFEPWGWFLSFVG